MIATTIIAICIGLYLAGFVFFEARRRKKGQRSLFTDDPCDCKSSFSARRMLAYYKKQKRLAAKKGK